jgi:hypothetical protein
LFVPHESKTAEAEEPLMKQHFAIGLALATLAGGLLTALPAAGETIMLKADMNAANEVPPGDSPATGHAEATFDTVTRALSWTVTYANLTGPAVGAHFHGPGEAGKNAGIVLPFASAASPIKGSATISEAQAADLLAGKWYANIHTSSNPGGEIRGQMLK